MTERQRRGAQDCSCRMNRTEWRDEVGARDRESGRREESAAAGWSHPVVTPLRVERCLPSLGIPSTNKFWGGSSAVGGVWWLRVSCQQPRALGFIVKVSRKIKKIKSIRLDQLGALKG